MPAQHLPVRNHANMYGLASHPRHYERVAGRLARPLYRRVLSDVVARALPTGAVVLDLGTGPGLLAEMIAQTCPGLSVVGVDLAPEMVGRARQRCAGTAGLRFELADVAALPFGDGAADLVVSSISLHHWDQPGAALAEVVRVLRPGAEAWIYDERRTLRRAARLATGLPAEVRLESSLRGVRLLPVGRLVLGRDR